MLRGVTATEDLFPFAVAADKYHRVCRPIDCVGVSYERQADLLCEFSSLQRLSHETRRIET